MYQVKQWFSCSKDFLPSYSTADKVNWNSVNTKYWITQVFWSQEFLFLLGCINGVNWMLTLMTQIWNNTSRSSGPKGSCTSYCIPVNTKCIYLVQLHCASQVRDGPTVHAQRNKLMKVICNSSATAHPQSSHLPEPLWIDSGLKKWNWCVRADFHFGRKKKKTPKKYRQGVIHQAFLPNSHKWGRSHYHHQNTGEKKFQFLHISSHHRWWLSPCHRARQVHHQVYTVFCNVLFAGPAVPDTWEAGGHSLWGDLARPHSASEGGDGPTIPAQHDWCRERAGNSRHNWQQDLNLRDTSQAVHRGPAGTERCPSGRHSK